MNLKKQQEMEDYLSDLQGYLILPAALSGREIEQLNQAIDAWPELEPGQWHGHVQRQNHHPNRGINWQNIIEGGDCFEELIDHPSWIDKVDRYVDNGLYIDEAFVSIRGPGQSINIHAGGHTRSLRGQFRFHNQQFFCGQINILVALTAIGSGDGATMVIAGSHKSNLKHPIFEAEYSTLIEESMDNALGAVEVRLGVGDAILFVDALCHGAASRENCGQRRAIIYRYGPRWGNARFGYEPSIQLLNRLSPARKRIVQPIKPNRPPEKS